MNFDEQEVRKTMALMRAEDNLVEIRIITNGKISSGYFTSADVLLQELAKQDLSHSQVYMTINKINPACYSREQKDCFKYGKITTTSDNDIVGYSFLMIDIDPTRPSETSSSNEELMLARKLGNKIFVFLQNIGFENPLTAYSGNGIHLMYKIRLKNDKTNKELVQKCLKTLDMLFSTEECKVDLTTFNPARISKLYGVVARKGTNTEERPHRMSKIVGDDIELNVTDIKYLQQLCSYYPQEMEKPSQYNKYDPKNFSLQEWLDKYGLRYTVGSYSDGTKFNLECCPFDSNHKGKDACVFQSKSGGIGFHCFHNSCADKTWKDVRIMFEPDAYEKKWKETEKKIYHNFNRDKAPEKKEIVEKDGQPVLLSALDIYNKPKAEESFIRTGTMKIDARLRGLKKGYVTVVSGLRGSAKSTWLSNVVINAIDEGNRCAVYSGELSDQNFMRWMNLQIAGKGKVEKGQYEGYYEVSKDRRLKIAQWLNNKFWLYNNEYGNDFTAIIEILDKKIDEHKIDLLVLDNLMSFNIRSLNENKWDAQTDFVWALQKLSKSKDIHIIFVAHPRKALGFLRLDDISGTADIGNAVDNAFIVHRVNNDFKRLTKQMFGWADDNELYKATNVVEVAKDRDGGTQDLFIGLYYEEESKRLKNFPTEQKLYGWDNPPKKAEQMEITPGNWQEVHIE